jgi:hypothetical protein
MKQYLISNYLLSDSEADKVIQAYYKLNSSGADIYINDLMKTILHDQTIRTKEFSKSQTHDS